MPYLNVVEVETALTVLSSGPCAPFCELIGLPHPTWEGRQCQAVRLGAMRAGARPAIFLLGGVHAREWGSADVLVNLVERLATAYANQAGLAFGGKAFTFDDVRSIIEGTDLIVFPQANPDGRHYSMTGDALWRKNRRTSAPNTTACSGVDLNRNLDFLWDFSTHFNPASGVTASSDPCEYQFYHGPAAFSEPETLNIKWIMDSYPGIRFFVDTHCYGEQILHSWGDDENQSAQTEMSFRNPRYGGLRGLSGDLYKEYIPQAELNASLSLAEEMQRAISSVRGTTYAVAPAYSLYPTAGATDDYAFSRYFSGAHPAPILSFTLEYGKEFQPPYDEMRQIIDEVNAGLIAFCLTALTI